jgi:hypothetical protein
MNAVYIQGSLFESLSSANHDIFSISVLLKEFEKQLLPFAALAAANVTQPPLSAIHHIMLDSGLQQELNRLDSAMITSGSETNFTSIHQALKLLRFDRFESKLQTFSSRNVSNENIFSIVSSEFSKQRHFFERLNQFSRQLMSAFTWVSPWVVSSWPWLLVVLLSFLQLQSVIIRSFSMFSTIILSATCLQIVAALLAFILFSVSTVINDLCTFLPEKSAEYWQSITESSYFWKRFGKGCLSEQSRNLFAAFDPSETVSCDSVLNVSQYSIDVAAIMNACKHIVGVDVESRLNALEATNPNFVAEFLSIRFAINQSYSLLTTQWPAILESLEQASNNCTSYLQRCVFLPVNATMISFG